MMIGARRTSRSPELICLAGTSTCWAVLLRFCSAHRRRRHRLTFYTPFSSSYSNGRGCIVPGIFINGFSAILTGLNFIVTVHRMRAPGLTWFRLPLFVWALYATSAIMILGTPVIAVTLFLLVLERGLHIGFFDPAYGGDPVLFQHLFWFYSHPAVYIMILPSMGVISEVISTFSSKKQFGYTFIAFSFIAIAVFGFLVWGHHLFVAGQSIYAGLVFSVLSYVVAIPSAIKVFNWAATMYKDKVRMETGRSLCARRLHRPVYHRWTHRHRARFARHGRPPDRYLLRDRTHFHCVWWAGHC